MVNREGNVFSASGNMRSRWFLFRDMGPLGQPVAEGDVLARRLVERDQEIIWRDSRRCDHCVVQGLQQAQSLPLGAAGNKRDLQYG